MGKFTTGGSIFLQSDGHSCMAAGKFTTSCLINGEIERVATVIFLSGDLNCENLEGGTGRVSYAAGCFAGWPAMADHACFSSDRRSAAARVPCPHAAGARKNP
jgi:hypothetical protein